MPLWDDLKTTGRRVREVVEDRSGRQVIRREDLERVTEAAAEGAVYRKELEYVGWTILNHVGADRTELKPQSRRMLALKSLNAYISDPMAGGIVDRYVSFVFGRGVPKPQARDPEVQKRIDEAWADRANRRILTTPEKLAEKGRDYCTQSNIFFVYFDDGADGMVRMSLGRFDTFEQVYRHPEDRFRILFYVAREKAQRWNPDRVDYEDVDDGPPKIVYYEALDAYDEESVVEAMMDEGVWTPAPGQVGRGKVLHLAGNKTSEMAFGVPQFKRLLRWFTAYNEVLESFGDRMKAAARLYMKASVTGGASQMERAGLMAVRRANPMGGYGGVSTTEAGTVEGGPGVPRPGTLGVVQQNVDPSSGRPLVNYEPFKIDSGAGDVASAAPVMRGQIAAGGGFPAHYMGGDPGSLAGSQSVELPVLKFIEGEQEVWARPFRALADLTIKRSVELGFLDEWRAPTEGEQTAIADGTYDGEVNDRGQVKRDLSYSFSLPSPLQRMMTDVVSAAVQTATAVDPNGDFPELSRWLFGFILAEAFDVEDPQKIVDEVLPMERVKAMLEQRQAMQDAQMAGAAAMAAGAQDAARPDASTAPPTTTGADGKQHPPDNPAGARRQSAQPEDRKVQQAAAPDRRARARVAARRLHDGGDYEALERFAVAQAAGIGASNGHPEE